MPKRPPPRPLFDRIVDRALGVSRRKRRIAFYTIGVGLGLLRPALRRIAYGSATLLLILVVWRGYI